MLVDPTTSIDLVTNTIHAQSDSLGTFVVATAPNLQFQFSATSYSVSEGAGFATITLSRLGDVSGAPPAMERQRKGEITRQVMACSFGAGETSKSFSVLIIDNAFVDGGRTVNLTLSNATGAALGTQSTAVLTINDNDTVNGPNPIETMNLSPALNRLFGENQSRVTVAGPI